MYEIEEWLRPLPTGYLHCNQRMAKFIDSSSEFPWRPYVGSAWHNANFTRIMRLRSNARIWGHPCGASRFDKAGVPGTELEDYSIVNDAVKLRQRYDVLRSEYLLGIDTAKMRLMIKLI